MKNPNILVVGQGGREHALAWKLVQSPRAGKLYVAPGNGGTSRIAENVAIGAMDFDALIAFAKDNHVDFTVVGSDNPLAAGIVDRFQHAGLKIFGPTQAAAQIEASKSFAKKLMQKAQIPTAQFATFSDPLMALNYLKNQNLPIVVKASGLALGKGVYICKTLAEAKAAVEEMMVKKRFGEAGREVVIEEFLTGDEVSIHALSDGRTSATFPTARDHKPIGEDNTGPNTGGMGVVAPVPGLGADFLTQAQELAVSPVLKTLQKDGIPFVGCLYPGLMIGKNGVKVLEYNARFGDPETQAYMRLLKSDLVEVIETCIEGRLSQIKLEWESGFAVCVVLASGGYPGEYKTGYEVTGLTEAAKISGVEIFHAGTQLVDNQLKTAGGRVLNVTAIGKSLEEARRRAYTAIAKIDFTDMYYRSDIGLIAKK